MKKIAMSCIGAPQCELFLTNGGVCQSVQNGPSMKFSTISCAKLKFKDGIFYGKYLRPYGAGLFG